MNKLKHVWTGRLGLGSCMGMGGGFGGGTPPCGQTDMPENITFATPLTTGKDTTGL